jgi:hypothetical protein
MTDQISESAFRKALTLYREFHGKAAGWGKIVGIKQEGDIAALEVGQFFGIIYIAEGKKYLHKFNANNRPQVFVSSDGRQVYVIGGSYRFTDRGFVG